MAAFGIRQTAHATARSLFNASSDLSRTLLSLPQTYATYVAQNPSAVSRIESTVNSMSYLLPSTQLQDTELAQESVLTFIGLLSMYHDHLLRKRADLFSTSSTLSHASDLKSLKPNPSLHGKYTIYWTSRSSVYSKFAAMLKLTEYTQLLLEMVAKRRGGDKSRWRLVIVLEMFKAFCRLMLLRLTNSRPLVSPPTPQREDIISAEPETDDNDFHEDDLKMVDEVSAFDPKGAFANTGVPTPPLSEHEKGYTVNSAEPFTLPRTGHVLPILPNADLISNYLLSHVLTPDDVKPAKQLLHRLTTLQGQAAEVLHIFRPVIYALLLQRISRTYGYEGSKWKKHWGPWLVGVSIDYFSRQLGKRDLASRVPGGYRSGLSSLERDELKKRDWSMAWWGMRGAFYENVTKKYVGGVTAFLSGKPVLDLAGNALNDYSDLWSNYYFSTSTL